MCLFCSKLFSYVPFTDVVSETHKIFIPHLNVDENLTLYSLISLKGSLLPKNSFTMCITAIYAFFSFTVITLVSGLMKMLSFNFISDNYGLCFFR